MLRILGILITMLASNHLFAEQNRLPNFVFESIDGGKIELNQFLGKPLLITNTASKCGFTRQYRGLQQIHDNYRNEGLIVLGIPSTDFKQEFKSDAEVKDFCEVNFGIDFPMTEITNILGQNAHPFYKWLFEEYNFRPRWNFNKILFDRKGYIVNTYGATVGPTSKKLTAAIVSALKNSN